MRINANITRKTTDSSRRFEYMVVASPVVQDTAVTGCVVLISPMDVVRYPLRRLYWVLLASCIVAIVLMLIPLSYFLQRMVKPLAQMNVVALSMAKGDFSQRADESTRGEIGELAHSVNHLAEQLGQTVQALMLERNRLHHMLNGLSDGILALDEDGDLLHTNPALFSLFDMNRLSDVVGSIDPALLADIKAVAESGTPLLRDIGSGSRILHMIATPIIDDKGIRRGVVTLFHDITESERLEQTRREYVANVSHELRTPLSAVRGLAEALSDGLITTSEDRNRYYGHILRECMRLSRLIEDLLELSRLQSGNIALKKQKVDLPQLLTDIRTRYETLSDDLGIGFAVDCTQACPAVLANADRIAQVLVILLDNAFKFTDEGGQVTVRVVCGEQKVTVCVEDNGSGIEKEDLPHVFERFYKAEKAHSGNGTGLGLSIANEVITLMGETIWATSEPNAGSTFCFTLQRADA
jgi:signal transduction histidine kinase